MSTNSYNDSNAEDYLDAVRKHIAENKAGNTNERSFSPNYLLGVEDELDIGDSVSLNNNKHEFSDSIQLSDDAQVTGYTSGQFQATDDSGGGPGVTQPGKIDFADCG